MCILYNQYQEQWDAELGKRRDFKAGLLAVFDQYQKYGAQAEGIDLLNPAEVGTWIMIWSNPWPGCSGAVFWKNLKWVYQSVQEQVGTAERAGEVIRIFSLMAQYYEKYFYHNFLCIFSTIKKLINESCFNRERVELEEHTGDRRVVSMEDALQIYYQELESLYVGEFVVRRSLEKLYSIERLLSNELLCIPIKGGISNLSCDNPNLLEQKYTSRSGVPLIELGDCEECNAAEMQEKCKEKTAWTLTPEQRVKSQSELRNRISHTNKPAEKIRNLGQNSIDAGATKIECETSFITSFHAKESKIFRELEKDMKGDIGMYRFSVKDNGWGCPLPAAFLIPGVSLKEVSAKHNYSQGTFGVGFSFLTRSFDIVTIHCEHPSDENRNYQLVIDARDKDYIVLRELTITPRTRASQKKGVTVTGYRYSTLGEACIYALEDKKNCEYMLGGLDRSYMKWYLKIPWGRVKQ